MKRSHKFFVIFLIITIVCSAAAAVVTSVELANIRSTANKTFAGLVAVIKDKYPDIKENEIASILNDSDSNTEVSDFLEKYGINAKNQWIVYENDVSASVAVIVSFAMCAVSCLALCGIFILYCRQRRKEAAQITDYITQINKKNYNLAIEENSEDEMSALKNEIYKTTVMLKEQSENSMLDKENLKNSLSDISHQLKTPLTSVIIMLDNILDDPNMPDDIRIDFLNDIKHETTNISFLVQSILTLSKLDANSIVFKPKFENVSQIVDECMQKTAVLAELKGATVTAECDDYIKIKCDFKWLCEAVTNIVKNCIEHTESGGYVKLTVVQNKLYTKISIADNGCGISAKDLPHIFERFYKGHNSSDDSVGIGLALAKTIVEKGGGYLTVDSQEGKGSTFEIKFFMAEMR